MKYRVSLFALVMVVGLLIASCAPQPGAAPTPAGSPIPGAVQPVGLIAPSLGSTTQWVDGSTLIFVPAGDFTMGVTGGKDNPQHTVTLDNFWIYQSKVTNRQYALCVGTGNCQLPSDPKAAQDLNDQTLLDHPVVGVTWAQSQSYCQWVQGHLPTEAQWEKTARGAQGNDYPWGATQPDATLLNFNDNLGTTSKVTDFVKGQSFYGAYDLEGNAFEWVADWYNADYYPTAPQKNPPGPDSGTVRSMRGSSFSSTADQVLAYMRFSFAPDKNRPDLGFRCVVDNPTAFAPYCETSLLSAPPVDCPRPTVQTGSGCRNNAPAAGGTVSGTIQSVNADPPLKCVFQGKAVVCSGPPSTTGKVTICTQGCGTGSLGCPPNYHEANGRCVPDVSMAPAGGGSIQPAAGGPTSAPSGQGSGQTLTQTGGTNIVQQVGCPQGTYLDKSTGACVSLTGGINQCLAGYTFANGCCQVPAGSGAKYPGCGPNETFDTQTMTCVPAGQGVAGCTTVAMTTGTCGGKTQGGGSCQPPSGGCANNGVFNSSTCQCEGGAK